jgi:hypothetical protein
MTCVTGVAICWVCDEPWPGLIEVVLTDALGQRWPFVDKCAVFSREWFSAATSYPVVVEIACQELSSYLDDNGEELVVISTETPLEIESTDGQMQFTVFRHQVRE